MKSVRNERVGRENRKEIENMGSLVRGKRRRKRKVKGKNVSRAHKKLIFPKWKKKKMYGKF